MSELIWHPMSEEPEDKNCILWFISGIKKNSKVRLASWNNRESIYGYAYAWAYPVLPNF